MRDIIEFAEKANILVQGRGSAANSAVCYCLGITAVDPIRHDLLFERFLSDARDGYPDIDLDIEHHRREEVLQYVYRRYGREYAAMVCAHHCFRGRSAVHDTARVLGFGPDESARLAAKSGRKKCLEEADVAAAGFDIKQPRIKSLLQVVDGLWGPSTTSRYTCWWICAQHSGDYIILPCGACSNGRTHDLTVG